MEPWLKAAMICITTIICTGIIADAFGTAPPAPPHQVTVADEIQEVMYACKNNYLSDEVCKEAINKVKGN
jgi:hypothetical protein